MKMFYYTINMRGSLWLKLHGSSSAFGFHFLVLFPSFPFLWSFLFFCPKKKRVVPAWNGDSKNHILWRATSCLSFCLFCRFIFFFRQNVLPIWKFANFFLKKLPHLISYYVHTNEWPCITHKCSFELRLCLYLESVRMFVVLKSL